MKRPREAVLAAAIAIVTLAVPSAAGSASLPIVSVTSGPTTSVNFIPDCADVALPLESADSFVIKRDSAGPSQDIVYLTSGTAVAGSDYDPLPGVATIPAGTDHVAVPVHVLDNNDNTHVATLALTITNLPNSDYIVGEPTYATITFISHRDPSLSPVDCNPEFFLNDSPNNTEQTIRVGSRPKPLSVTAGEFTQFSVQVTDGSLPDGVRLDPGSRPPDSGFGEGGGFIGAATAAGTFAATLRVCPEAIVFTCRTTTLTVHVLPSTALARTGAPMAVEGLSACSLIAFGLAVQFAATRRRRLRAG